MPGRLSLAIPRLLMLGVAMVAAGCTGSGDATPTTTTETPTTVPAPTTTAPATILDVTQQLALQAGQCWGDLPTPQPSTSVPQPATVAVVDCAGSNLGLVYGNGCLGAQPTEAREAVVVIECPGRPEDPWPGDRAVGPTLASYCLPLFEAGVGERYAISELEAIELFATEELWVLGDRRFICTAQRPPE